MRDSARPAATTVRSAPPPRRRASRCRVEPSANAVVPPSIEMSAPLMYDASSEARNAASLATSSGSPKRPLGIVAKQRRAGRIVERLDDRARRGVRICPGLIETARMCDVELVGGCRTSTARTSARPRARSTRRCRPRSPGRPVRRTSSSRRQPSSVRRSRRHAADRDRIRRPARPGPRTPARPRGPCRPWSR
jgi:hypothetical protein